MSGPSPHRALAAAVLMRAIKDVYGMAPKVWKDDAKEFLKPENPVLADYCEGLDLDPAAFCAAVRQNGYQWTHSRFVKVALEA